MRISQVVAMLFGCIVLIISIMMVYLRHWPSSAYLIVFVAERNGDTDTELYIMRADGGGVRQLTFNDVNDQYLRGSSNGMWIVFEAMPRLERDNELYRVNVSDVSLEQLTDNERFDTQAALSPDGTSIAFASGPVNYSSFDIYHMNADGTQEQQLTFDGFNTNPIWSPDGTWIVYTSVTSSGADLYRVRPDGSYRQRLTQMNAIQIAETTWSSDGERIAFRATTNTHTLELYRVHANGSNLHRLTANDSYDVFPAWSPNGQWLTYASNRDGDWEIYRMRADGSGKQKLTDNFRNYDGDSSWSPDGQWIAFLSNRDDLFEVYRMRADGSDQQQLTDNDDDKLGMESWGGSGGPHWMALDLHLPVMQYVMFGGILMFLPIGFSRLIAQVYRRRKSRSLATS